MNKAITSRDEILKVCCDMVAENGISSINMRTIANTCGVALGSLYNYFPSKADLLSCTIEAVWKDIFNLDYLSIESESFVAYLSNLFESVKKCGAKYPEFFSMHALSFSSEEKQEGRKVMDGYFMRIKQSFVQNIRNDKKVSKDAFRGKLTPEIFADYIFTLFLSEMLTRKSSGETLISFVENFLYE